LHAIIVNIQVDEYSQLEDSLFNLNFFWAGSQRIVRADIINMGLQFGEEFSAPNTSGMYNS